MQIYELPYNFENEIVETGYPNRQASRWKLTYRIFSYKYTNNRSLIIEKNGIFL